METRPNASPAAGEHAERKGQLPTDVDQNDARRASSAEIFGGPQSAMQRLRDAVGPLVGIADDVELTDDQVVELVTRVCRRAENVPGLGTLTRDLDHPEVWNRPDVEGVPPGFGAGVPPSAPSGGATSITERERAVDGGLKA